MLCVSICVVAVPSRYPTQNNKQKMSLPLVETLDVLQLEPSPVVVAGWYQHKIPLYQRTADDGLYFLKGFWSAAEEHPDMLKCSSASGRRFYRFVQKSAVKRLLLRLATVSSGQLLYAKVTTGPQKLHGMYVCEGLKHAMMEHVIKDFDVAEFRPAVATAASAPTAATCDADDDDDNAAAADNEEPVAAEDEEEQITTVTSSSSSSSSLSMTQFHTVQQQQLLLPNARSLLQQQQQMMTTVLQGFVSMVATLVTKPQEQMMTMMRRQQKTQEDLLKLKQRVFKHNREEAEKNRKHQLQLARLAASSSASESSANKKRKLTPQEQLDEDIAELKKQSHQVAQLHSDGDICDESVVAFYIECAKRTAQLSKGVALGTPGNLRIDLKVIETASACRAARAWLESVASFDMFNLWLDTHGIRLTLVTAIQRQRSEEAAAAAAADDEDEDGGNQFDDEEEEEDNDGDE